MAALDHTKGQRYPTVAGAWAQLKTGRASHTWPSHGRRSINLGESVRSAVCRKKALVVIRDRY